jgi:hypothetical protein
MANKKLEILVVEDRAENRQAAKEFFDQLGKFSVDYATNLEEAKELLKKKDYILGIFDLDMPIKDGGNVVEKAGLELGGIAREKENMFYVYYSGGFFHGTPRTRVYLSEEGVSKNQDFDTYSKESSRGWEELYEKLVGIGKEVETPESREVLKRSLERYIKEVGKLPKIYPKSMIPYTIDLLELNERGE